MVPQTNTLTVITIACAGGGSCGIGGGNLIIPSGCVQDALVGTAGQVSAFAATCNNLLPGVYTVNAVSSNPGGDVSDGAFVYTNTNAIDTVHTMSAVSKPYPFYLCAAAAPGVQGASLNDLLNSTSYNIRARAS